MPRRKEEDSPTRVRDGWERSWREWEGCERDVRSNLHKDTLVGAVVHATRMVEEWQSRLGEVSRALIRRKDERE